MREIDGCYHAENMAGGDHQLDIITEKQILAMDQRLNTLLREMKMVIPCQEQRWANVAVARL